MSVLKVNSIQPTTPGSEDYFLAKAWVNFNGTGTVAIRASGNVSTITDNGTGNYTVNFTTAMPDTNYIANTNCMASGTSSYGTGAFQRTNNTKTASAYQIVTSDPSNGSFDSTTVHVSIFR